MNENIITKITMYKIVSYQMVDGHRKTKIKTRKTQWLSCVKASKIMTTMVKMEPSVTGYKKYKSLIIYVMDIYKIP